MGRARPGVGGFSMSVGDAFEGAQGGVERRGDGGGEKAAGAARGEEAADGGEGFGRGFHDVVAGGAVDVHVEEGGRERGAGEVEYTRAGGQRRRCAACDREDAAVFNFNDGVVDVCGLAPEPGRGDDCTHEDDYCRRSTAMKPRGPVRWSRNRRFTRLSR